MPAAATSMITVCAISYHITKLVALHPRQYSHTVGESTDTSCGVSLLSNYWPERYTQKE